MVPVVVIELFSGCGGATLGFLNGGARRVICFDTNADANMVHERNLNENRVSNPMTGSSVVVDMELGTLDAWQYITHLRGALRGDGYHVHLHASPPCQAFSVATNTSAHLGTRLMNWTLDLIQHIEPDSWSLENVLPCRKYLPDWVKYEIVNCALYQVPQYRKRVIAGEGFTLTPSEKRMVTMRNALPNMEGKVLSENINPHIRPHTLYEPARTITSQSAGQLRIEDEGSFPVVRRSLTMVEAAILQGFPPDYDFSVARTQKARWTMIGNALPPQISEAIMKGLNK